MPNANTLIIDNADRLGLSQLHQIRGRVGRSSRRAYAYLTFTRNKVLTDVAQKRLSAIREFTEFGSGFKIAMRDLEIRGAGNILGGEQHGHMEAVGYDLYLKLLGEAIRREKGEDVQPLDEGCLIDVQIQAHIPESYISDLNQRLEIYRRIADVRTRDDALDVTDELIDRFGEPPQSVNGLIEIALLRSRAESLGVTEVKQQGDALLFYRRSIDMKQVSALVSSLKKRVMVNAGANPYVSVKLQGTPLETLSEVLELLSGDKKDEAAAERGTEHDFALPHRPLRHGRHDRRIGGRDHPHRGGNAAHVRLAHALAGGAAALRGPALARQLPQYCRHGRSARPPRRRLAPRALPGRKLAAGPPFPGHAGAARRPAPGRGRTRRWPPQSRARRWNRCSTPSICGTCSTSPPAPARTAPAGKSRRSSRAASPRLGRRTNPAPS